MSISKRIVYVHDQNIMHDSRAQKEICALKEGGHSLIAYDWDKENEGRILEEDCLIRNQKILVKHIQKKVNRGQGIRRNWKSLLFFEIHLLLELITNRNQFDYVHACNMDTAIIGLFLVNFFNKKLIYDIFDDYADCHNCSGLVYRFIKFIDKRIIRKAETVVICSEKRKQQLATLPKKLVVVHNSPDILDVNTSLIKIKGDKNFKLAYIGNLDDSRYLLELIEVVRAHQNWELHIGGFGSLSDKIESISKLEENVYFYGVLSYEKVLAIEAQCDLLPALYIPTIKNHVYAAPNKFYESLYLGKPIIMFKNTGVDDLVKEYESGVVCNFSVDDLEKAISKIEKENDYWKGRKQEMQEKYTTKFSWEIMKERLLSAYL